MKLNCACLRFASTSTRFTTMGKPASVFALWARRMQNCKNEALSFLALMSLMNIPLPIETSEKLCTSSLCEQSGRGEIKTMGVHSALRACICTASGAAMCKILQVRPLRTRIVHGNKLHISVTRWDVDCFYVEELGSNLQGLQPSRPPCSRPRRRRSELSILSPLLPQNFSQKQYRFKEFLCSSARKQT